MNNRRGGVYPPAKEGNKMAEKENTGYNCDTCEYYVYDEDWEEYVCAMRLDEDEMARYLNSKSQKCIYYKFYDEYKTVQKQN
jgi:hypothetical protein